VPGAPFAPSQLVHATSPHSSRELLLLIYAFALPSIWALLIGFDVARKLRPSRFAEWKAAGEFALGGLIVPLLQIVLVVGVSLFIQAGGRHVSSGAALKLINVMTLPFAFVGIWTLLSVPLFTLLLRLKAPREYRRRASDHGSQIALARRT